MILRNSLVVDPFDVCYDVGIYYENRGREEWGFWLASLSELFTSMGGLIVIAPPSLGKWND